MSEARGQLKQTEDDTILNKSIVSKRQSSSIESGQPTTTARERLAANLLVDVFSRTLPRNYGFQSKSIFVDFLIDLAKTASSDSVDRGLSDRAAIGILKTLEATLEGHSQSKALNPFLVPELLTVIPVLQTHRVFDDSSKALRERIIQELEETATNNNSNSGGSSNNRASTPTNAPPINSSGSSSSLSPPSATATSINTSNIMDFSSDLGHLAASGIADRIAPGSDPASAITNLLSDVGPACTRSESTFRETLQEFRRSSLLDEAAMARLLYFFSTKKNNPNETSSSGLSLSLLGSLLPGRNDDDGTGNTTWKIPVVQQVIARDYQASLDWTTVAMKWDFYDFQIRDTEQFRNLLDLYRAGAQRLPPVAALTARWHHSASQCSLLEAIMSVPASIFVCELGDQELADAATTGSETQIMTAIPNPRCWASASVLQCLLYLTEIPSISRRVRDLFIKGLLSCPEVILCALIRLSLNQSTDNLNPNVGKQMKSECMRELVPLFFKPNSGHRVQNGPAACRRVWDISPNTFTAACIEGWRSTAQDPPQARLGSIVHIISIVRLLPPPSPEAAVKSLLEGQDAEFSIALYFVLADKANYQLKTWLSERAQIVGPKFIAAIITYLAKFYQTASPRQAGAMEGSPLVSLENMSISLQVLLTLDKSIMAKQMPTTTDMTIGDSIKSLTEACIQTHPSIRAGISAAINNQQQQPEQQQQQQAVPAAAADDDIEEKANSYFQKIYTSEQSIGEVVEMLKRFKTSNDTRENEIFACMIRNLFDEYRFFSKYPEKELRITGILFGTLIKEQLVNSITLGIALRYVLEALRRPPSPAGSTTSSSGKMFRFGMFALEQFKERLHEWPQYCSHIVQIPHLKDGYADLVSEIENAMAHNRQDAPPAPTEERQRSSSFASSSDSLPAAAAPPPATGFEVPIPAPRTEKDTRVAEFGPNLGRAVTQEVDDDIQHEAPPDAVLDRVQFLINNVSPSNVEKKSQELKEMLEPQYFDWLGHYLVVKRISAQPNFHSLYLAFLDNLGEYGKGLIQSILSSVYLNIGKLLRSPKITTSTSERSLLKNLGSWLGQITIARNRPILQLMLDCKELLFQGYENGRLIAVTPFVAKILEGAKNSNVFRPPNPWVMGLLGVFRALYAVEDLKMNIKFEVEVLCKNLNIKLEDISPRSAALAKRIPPVKERNPDFNMKSSMANAAASSSNDMQSPEAKTAAAFGGTALGGLAAGKTTSSSSSSKDQQTVIPNLASYVTINPNLTTLIQQAQGTTLASTMSAATLQRSVPIAVDRAIREIIQPVVERSVTIACITTKEIVTKDFATEGDENKMHKAAQLMVANLAGSLALVTCRDPLRNSVSTHLRQLLSSGDKLTEQEQSTIEQCVAIVATDNMELGCKLIEKAATEKAVRDVDEALTQALSARRKHREQTGGQPYYDMAVLGNESQRYPGALPEPLRPQRGGLRPEQLRVYEAFQRMPRQAPPAMAPESKGAQRLNLEALNQIAAKIDSSVTSLLSAAGSRAPEVTLSMLPAEHEVRQLLAAVQQVVPRTLSETEKKSALGFAQGIFRRLYELDLSEPLRLEALVALLEKMNEANSQLGNDLGTWTTYAPTDTEVQRKLHRTVLLLLVRSNLVSPQELDGFLSSSSDNGRNPVWVEFSLLFIRTAFLERIASPTDFPKLMELMTNVADGRSQANPQVAQTLRKPILRMLEEVRGSTTDAVRSVIGPAAPPQQKPATVEQSSMLSSASLANLSNGSKVAALSLESFARNDHPNAKQQVTSLLDSWIRVHSEAASNEKALAQFLQLLKQFGVGKTEEQTERFFRLSTQIVVDAVIKTSNGNGDGKNLNYTVIDIYTRLVPLIFQYLNDGGTDEQLAGQRIALLNKALGVMVRCMMWDYERNKKDGNGAWDQRPWFRLLLNLSSDMNSPNELFDKMKSGILGVFGTAYHVIQPLVVPGFAFAWLEIVSHRAFLPNLLLLEGDKGFSVVHQLLVDMLLFLEPHLRNIDLTPAIKKLYEGTLRVLLVLLHDFPSFLSGYHLSLCNVIPENCVQLRNVILSAVPKGMTLPDPFTPNLKIDSLAEVSQSPAILSNVLGPLQSLRSDLDAFLKDRHQRSDFVSGLLPRLFKAGTMEVDAPRVNSLVLCVGMHGINRLQTSQVPQTLGQTPELEILEKLMELDDHGRYISLNAIANQLRYPSSHTHYFSCVMLFLFSEAKNVAVKEQVTRVLLERLILHRPHPWGLLITFIELIKNQRYQFWSHSFTRCATEIEKVFESVARSCMAAPQRTSLVGGGEASQQ